MDDLRKLRERLEKSEPKDETERRTLGVLRSLDSVPITLVMKTHVAPAAEGLSKNSAPQGTKMSSEDTTTFKASLEQAAAAESSNINYTSNENNKSINSTREKSDNSSAMNLKEADEMVSNLKSKYKPISAEMAGKQQSVFEGVERKLIQCYATNKGQTLNCSQVLKEYRDYVSAQRSQVLRKSVHVSPVLSTVMLVIACLLLHIATVNCYGAMSIDLGSEWMKVGLVAPSVQMDIVLNAQSQRKTPMAIAFSNGERFIGDTAMDVASKYPERTFTHFLDLVGKTIDHESVNHYKQRFPYANISAAKANSSSTPATTTATSDPSFQSIILNHPEGLEFTPLELIAMMLQHAHDQVVNRLNSFEPASDVVITVPPFFGAIERRVIEDAAKLVGLNVLRLTNTNSAFALSYGIFRHNNYLPESSENKTSILFFDQGASQTSATLADYQLLEQFDESTGLSKNESMPTVTIRAQVYDRYLGGFDMQLKLRDYMVDAFAQKTKIDKSRIIKRGKSMAKLLKEAGRVKKILSANTDHTVRVENVIDDQDLKHPVTRQDLEDMTAEYLGSRITQLLDRLFEMPGVSRNDPVESIIIVGGNTRTPKIQQILLDYFKLDTLGKSINADEGAALAALYQAASLGRGFRVKKFVLREFNETVPSANSGETTTPVAIDEFTVGPDNQTTTQEPQVDPLEQSRIKLQKLRDQDELRLKRLSLKNSLESLLSEARDKLSEDAEKMKLVSETYTWIESGPRLETDNVTLLNDKYQNIHELVYPRPPTPPPFDPSKVDLSSVLSNETLSILDSLNFTNPFAQATTTASPETNSDGNSTLVPQRPPVETSTNDSRGPPPHSEL